MDDAPSPFVAALLFFSEYKETPEKNPLLHYSMSLKEKTLKGLSWSFASQIGKQLTQFFVTAALARSLTSEDFGLIGMATVFVGLFTLLNERGLSAALIQNQRSTQTHSSSVFWFNLALGGLLTLLGVSVASCVAKFYHRDELKLIFSILSFNFLIASLAIVPRAMLTKTMNFKKLSVLETLALAIGGGTGVALAFNGFGFWSLVAQSLVYNAALVILFWSFSHWKPSFIFSSNAIRELSKFSSHLTLSAILNYISRNIDYLLIGKLLGAGPLGYYTLAYKLMMYPLQNICWVISKVMFPALSRIQNNKPKVQEAYLKITKGVSLITFPALCGLLVATPEFITVVFGAKWLPASNLIRILCVCGMIQSFVTAQSDILLSQGRTDLQLKLGTFGMLFSVLGISIGVRWGIHGVAFGYTLVQSMWVPYGLSRINQLLGLPTMKFAGPLFKSFILSVLMAGGAFAIKTLIGAKDLNALILMIVSGGILYAALLFIFERSFIHSTLSAFRKSKTTGSISPKETSPDILPVE